MIKHTVYIITLGMPMLERVMLAAFGDFSQLLCSQTAYEEVTQLGSGGDHCIFVSASHYTL